MILAIASYVTSASASEIIRENVLALAQTMQANSNILMDTSSSTRNDEHIKRMRALSSKAQGFFVDESLNAIEGSLSSTKESPIILEARMLLKKLDASPSYQKGVSKLEELNLYDDDVFFAYKMQAREDRLQARELQHARDVTEQEGMLLKLPQISYGDSPYTSRRSSANSQSNYRRSSSRKPSHSSLFSSRTSFLSSQASQDSIDDMLERLVTSSLTARLKNTDSIRDSRKRSTQLVKSALVKSILSRRGELSQLARRVSEAPDPKEFFRRGSRRQSIGWSPNQNQQLEAPVFVTQSVVVQVVRKKMTLKYLMKKIVNVFHFFRFMSKCLKNQLERGWEFDFRAPIKNYRIASMARREHYFMV
jgi:hypothetical protein